MIITVTKYIYAIILNLDLKETRYFIILRLKSQHFNFIIKAY